MPGNGTSENTRTEVGGWTMTRKEGRTNKQTTKRSYEQGERSKRKKMREGKLEGGPQLPIYLNLRAKGHGACSLIRNHDERGKEGTKKLSRRRAGGAQQSVAMNT